MSSGSPGVPGSVGRGGGGPAGSGLAFPGAARPWVRDDGRSAPPAASSPAPAGPAAAAAARGGRPGNGKEGKAPRSGCAAGRGWRAARPCRRGRPAGAGAGWSRAVTSCAPSPLPGVEAAGPDAGRRGGLACRPGPQASSLHSARPVKSARPGAGAGLTRGPEPRVDAGRCPPGQEGAAPAAGRPRAGTAKGARWRAPRRCAPPSSTRPPPARRPGAGSPGCAQRVILSEGSVIGRSLAPPGFPSTTEIGFSGPFFAGAPEIGAGEAKKRGCWREVRLLPAALHVPRADRRCTWRETTPVSALMYLAGSGGRPRAAGRGHARPRPQASRARDRAGTRADGAAGAASVAVPAAPSARAARYAALAAASALVPGSPAASGAGAAPGRGGGASR